MPRVCQKDDDRALYEMWSAETVDEQTWPLNGRTMARCIVTRWTTFLLSVASVNFILTGCIVAAATGPTFNSATDSPQAYRRCHTGVSIPL